MLHLILFANFNFVHGATVSYVTHEIKPTLGGTKNAIAGARSGINKLNVAAREHDVDGRCEVIDWDSGTTAEQESGFTFMKKKKTIEIYSPPKQVFERTTWLLPGYFGAGSQLELYFTVPTSNQWAWFEICIVDTTETALNVYDANLAIVLALISVNRTANALYVRGFGSSRRWQQFGALTPLPFSQGGAYKITFRPSDVMKVYVDDVEVASYSHLTPPGSARKLSLSQAGFYSIFQINNITFVGV